MSLPPGGPASRVDYGAGVSGAEALRNRVSRNRSSHPGITNIVMASMLLGSARARNDALERDDIDLYLSLDLNGVKLLDFEAIRYVAERGYQATVEQLENL